MLYVHIRVAPEDSASQNVVILKAGTDGMPLGLKFQCNRCVILIPPFSTTTRACISVKGFVLKLNEDTVHDGGIGWELLGGQVVDQEGFRKAFMPWIIPIDPQLKGSVVGKLEGKSRVTGGPLGSLQHFADQTFRIDTGR